MKKLVPALALLGTFGAAQAQPPSGVTLYGLVDTTVRYTTNENAAGGSLTRMTDGVLTGSRLGLRGTEDLGGGLRAKFVLEHGFMPDEGTVAQGGIHWGRQAFVGLDLPAGGDLRLGRQYTVAHEILASNEAMGFANNGIMGFQGNYTGVRTNNMLRYAHKLGGLTAILGVAAGEAAGTEVAALGAVYEAGPLRMSGVYQQRDAIASYFGTTVASGRQTTWGLGGTYQFQPVKVFVGYTDSELEQAGRQNQVAYAGFNYKVGAAGSLIGTVNFDRLSGTGIADGKRLSTSLMYDHFLSKRTDVYVAVDYHKLEDGWMSLATTNGFSTPFYGDRNTRTGLQIGIRHAF